uniref:PDZ domain-containing protein MAGIX isoform X2 n=1 Tax=Jaculus jaculus TaxID=51337 RepID=UPI001E1B58E0|nr:PDZ domain-containing protein MAGIX isoform X2 [Jaculus jaculus]
MGLARPQLRPGLGEEPGRGLSAPASPRARQLLARLDARPLAARAAADVSALARKASATLRLRTKEAVDVLDSADIEVTDSRLPHATQVGDHVLHVNGKSTQGLTHAQVVERIRAGGPRLCLVLHRPQEIHASRLEGAGGRQQGDRIPDPKVPETLKSRSISISPVHHPPKIQARQEPRLETVAEGLAVSAPEQRTEDLDDLTPGSPGPWLVPSEERLSRALGVPGTAPLAQEMAAGRRRH